MCHFTTVPTDIVSLNLGISIIVAMIKRKKLYELHCLAQNPIMIRYLHVFKRLAVSLRRVNGGLFGPRQVRTKVQIDEKTLREVAKTTGGQYFRATSIEKLEEIYKEIGEMEKTEIKTREYVNYRELFPAFLFPGLLMLGLESFLANTRFRRIP